MTSPTADVPRGMKDEVADRASDSGWVEALARAGLLSRGVLYLLVAGIAFRIARGHRGQGADKQGALEALARQPLGRLLVAALAVGFAGYALWRYVQGVLDPGGRSGWPTRLANVARGVLYTSFAATALPLVVGAGTGHDPGKEVDVTARVLAWPMGRLLVAGLGVAVVGGGAFQAWRAVTGSYWKKLADGAMRPAVRWAVVGVATVGLLARTVVFAVIGLFLVRAAARYDPREAAGVDEALARVLAAPHGPSLLTLVAGGLAAFGVYSFVEARYRRVPVQ